MQGPSSTCLVEQEREALLLRPRYVIHIHPSPYISGLDSIHSLFCWKWGHAVAQLVDALYYKSEGRGVDSR
jgi:hypothetical protein